MINENKTTEIILCSGIKMDRNYENVISYTEEQMVNLCRNNKIYNGYNYAIVQPNKTIDVACKYEDAIYANYIAFINPKYGNKWFFGWVTGVELRNPGTTRITFQVDVFSTWYQRFNLNQVFIEREHVDDDTIGKHTIPEGLETGEYITQLTNNNSYVDNLTDLGYLSQIYIVVGVSEMGLGVFTVPNDQKKYSGIYSGLRYLLFQTGRDLEKYIWNTEHNLSESNIYCVFLVPRAMVNIAQADFITVGGEGYDDIPFEFEFAFMPDSDYESDMGSIGIGKPEFLDVDYVPVNNKLLTFPYCYLNITNHVGITKDYHYELFQTGYCGFEIKGAISVGCAIRLYPVDYAFTSDVDDYGNKLHCIDAGKLPTCGWVNDAFTNWLTANSVNIGLSAVKDLVQIGVSTATGNVGGFIGGFSNIAGTIASIYEHSLQPATAKGGTNQGDLNYAMRNTFNIYRMSIKKEYAIIIDRYFSRFGYKVNEVKTPNLLSRTKFNFVKVGGLDELVSGNIPAVDLEEINRIFRKGVTIFHNYTDIGNYTISNPIVTP